MSHQHKSSVKRISLLQLLLKIERNAPILGEICTQQLANIHYVLLSATTTNQCFQMPNDFFDKVGC